MEDDVSSHRALKAKLCLYILFLQIFEYALFEISPAFKILDELIAMTAIFYVFFIIVSSRKKFLTQEKYILSCFTAIILLGLTANLIFKYQPIIATLGDVLIFAKFISGYFLSRLLLCDVDIDLLKKPINTFCRISSVILLGLIGLNIFTEIFPVYEEARFYLDSQQLFFGHPTFLGSTCVTLISLLIGMSDENNSNIIYIVFCMLAAAATFRFKILVFLLFCPMIIYYAQKNKKFSKTVMVAAILFGLVFSYQQINYYYIANGDFARSALTVTSIKIANDHFPLGSGLATFGSNQSAVYYSPVYQHYGLAKIWGISKDYPIFISDTFWPMMIGQFGYFGLLFFIAMIILFYSLIGRLRQINYQYYYSSLTCLIYLLISSSAESSFVQPYAVLFFYIIGMYISQTASDARPLIPADEVNGSEPIRELIH